MSDYKVGDKVKNISAGYRQEFGSEEDSRVVHGVVQEVDLHGVYVLWDNCEKAYYCFRGEIEPLEEKPMIKDFDESFRLEDGWKPGDKVKLLETQLECPDYRVGKIYTLSGIDGDGDIVVEEANVLGLFGKYQKVSSEEVAPIIEPVDVLYDESGSGSGVSCGPSFSELVEDFQLEFPLKGDEPKENTNGFNGIVSTGGCTAYYDFLPEWVTLNDMMDYKAQNQWGPLSFHMGNITKATYRFGEKDGTSQVYDLNKIIYSGLRAKLMLEDKQSVRDYLNELLNDPQFM